jgi:hypothetical protein
MKLLPCAKSTPPRFQGLTSQDTNNSTTFQGLHNPIPPSYSNFSVLSCCLWNWALNFNQGFLLEKAGPLPLEPYLQFILLWLFWRWGLWNYLPKLALNCNSLAVSLPNSWDYRHEPSAPGILFLFIGVTSAALRMESCPLRVTG